MSFKYKASLFYNRHIKYPLKRLRHSIAWRLLTPEARTNREIISDIWQCETEPKLGPNPIKLEVLTGHNQVVEIVNGLRKVQIIFYDQQVLANCWARVQVGEETEVVHPSNGAYVTANWMLPYNPEELRKLYQVQKPKS